MALKHRLPIQGACFLVTLCFLSRGEGELRQEYPKTWWKIEEDCCMKRVRHAQLESNVFMHPSPARPWRLPRPRPTLFTNGSGPWLAPLITSPPQSHSVEDSFVVLPAAVNSWVNSYFSVELITYGFRHHTSIIELRSKN